MKKLIHLFLAIGILICFDETWRPMQMKKKLNHIVQLSEKKQEHNELPEGVTGILSFENNLLNLPFVQGNDNQYYLSHAVDGSPFYQGTPFLDYRDDMQNQVITIYGHHVFDDDTAMFSPLMELEEQQGYEQNRFFSITTQNEKRKYVITNVFRSDSRRQFHPRYLLEETNPDFEQWIAYPDEMNEIIPTDQLMPNDRIVILQTCVRLHQSTKLYVLAKELS